jgi:Protein of unknown function (DUF1488)
MDKHGLTLVPGLQPEDRAGFLQSRHPGPRRVRPKYAARLLRNGTPTMALSFPNRSRSYDATRRAVRFWGHDSAMEASFFVTEDALKRVQPNVRLDEVGLLEAFDANRGLIYAAAAKVYRRGRRGSYDLIAADF